MVLSKLQVQENTHTHRHTKCSLISPLSGRIRWKQISSAPVTSSGTVVLLWGRYRLVSSTNRSTPQQIKLGKKKNQNTLFPPFSLFLFCSLTLFFQYRINLKGVNWKISFSGAHYQDLSLPCFMKFDERVPLHSSAAGAWEARVGGGWTEIEEMCNNPTPSLSSVKKSEFFN